QQHRAKRRAVPPPSPGPDPALGPRRLPRAALQPGRRGGGDRGAAHPGAALRRAAAGRRGGAGPPPGAPRGRGRRRNNQLLAAVVLWGCLLLAVGGATPSQAVTSNCPETVRGSSENCAFICYLTAIVFYRDPATGQIVYECDYGDCFTVCGPN